MAYWVLHQTTTSPLTNNELLVDLTFWVHFQHFPENLLRYISRNVFIFFFKYAIESLIQFLIVISTPVICFFIYPLGILVRNTFSLRIWPFQRGFFSIQISTRNRSILIRIKLFITTYPTDAQTRITSSVIFWFSALASSFSKTRHYCQPRKEFHPQFPSFVARSSILLRYDFHPPLKQFPLSRLIPSKSDANRRVTLNWWSNLSRFL